MSRLLGPLSETMSSVSWRDCARAGDQTAGAAIALAAAAPVDRRNARRSMRSLQPKPHSSCMPALVSGCGRAVARASPPTTRADRPAPAKCSSMQHEHRNGHGTEDATAGAAENRLAELGMAVCAHDEEVGARIGDVR